MNNLEPNYVFDLSHIGYSFSNGFIITAFIWFPLAIIIYFVVRRLSSPVKYIYIPFLLGTLFSLVFEVLGYNKYLENVESFQKMTNIKLECGYISNIDPDPIKDRVKEYQSFVVNELRFEYEINRPRYSYNVSFADNRFLREGNIIIVYYRGNDIIRMEIYKNTNLDTVCGSVNATIY